MDDKQHAEGNYQQDTQWKDVPTQGTYTQGTGSTYQQNGSWQGTSYQQASKPGNGFGIASMILGILALVLFCTCLNIPLAILSIIFAIIHLSRRIGSKGFAIAGIITSVVSIILTVIMIILFSIGAIDTSNYSTTLPFEQLIDGDGQLDFDENGDDSGEFINDLLDGEEQTL